MQRRRDGLKRVFDKLCKGEKQKPGKGGPTLSMDVFTQDLFERGIAREAARRLAAGTLIIRSLSCRAFSSLLITRPKAQS